jgi:hypothetical protein
MKSAFMLNRICLLAAVLLLSACEPKITEFEISSGEADFSRTVFLGGSYLAGYQDGGINIRAKNYSLAAQIHAELKKAGADPLVYADITSETGIGVNFKYWEYPYHTQSKLGDRTDCKGDVSMGPVKKEADAFLLGLLNERYSNVNCITVPFAGLAEQTDPYYAISPQRYGAAFFKRMNPFVGASTMLNDAVALNPSFFVSWPGFDDLLNYALHGGAAYAAPDAALFEKRLDTLLTELTKNGAKGVIATIPDMLNFPYFNLVKWDNADITQMQADSLNDIYGVAGLSHISFKEGRNGFVILDASAQGSVRQLEEGELITLSVPLDSMRCFKYGLIVNVVNNRYVMDKYEISILNNAIRDYNRILNEMAAKYNLAIADVQSFMKRIDNGIKENGADVKPDFVMGGFFSLDGIHPHEKGYALLASEFVKAINNKYKAKLPLVNCRNCRGVLFP